MSTTVVRLDENTHVIAAGNSQGVVRLFLLRTRPAVELVLIGQNDEAHNCPVISLTHVSVPSNPEGGLPDYLILSGGTDGRLFIWSIRRIVQIWLKKLEALPFSLPFTGSKDANIFGQHAVADLPNRKEVIEDEDANLSYDLPIEPMHPIRGIRVHQSGDHTSNACFSHPDRTFLNWNEEHVLCQTRS